MRKSSILAVLLMASLTGLVAVLYSTSVSYVPTLDDTITVHDDMKLEIHNSDTVSVSDHGTDNKTNISLATDNDSIKHYTINATDTPIIKQP